MSGSGLWNSNPLTYTPPAARMFRWMWLNCLPNDHTGHSMILPMYVLAGINPPLIGSAWYSAYLSQIYGGMVSIVDVMVLPDVPEWVQHGDFPVQVPTRIIVFDVDHLAPGLVDHCCAVDPSSCPCRDESRACLHSPGTTACSTRSNRAQMASHTHHGQ